MTYHNPINHDEPLKVTAQHHPHVNNLLGLVCFIKITIENHDEETKSADCLPYNFYTPLMEQLFNGRPNIVTTMTILYIIFFYKHVNKRKLPVN